MSTTPETSRATTSRCQRASTHRCGCCDCLSASKWTLETGGEPIAGLTAPRSLLGVRGLAGYTASIKYPESGHRSHHVPQRRSSNLCLASGCLRRHVHAPRTQRKPSRPSAPSPLVLLCPTEHRLAALVQTHLSSCFTMASSFPQYGRKPRAATTPPQITVRQRMGWERQLACVDAA